MIRNGTGVRRGGMLAALALAAAASGGCGEHKFEPPSRSAQVAKADSIYQAVDFDTVTWASDSARAFTGNEVYARACRDCHGYLGEGHTAYATSQGINAPSLVKPDWAYGSDVARVRERIFEGHPSGMPTWGVAHLTPREIDAAAYYVVRVLRPDAMKAGAASGSGPPHS